MRTAWLAHFSKRVTAAAEWLAEAKIIDAGPAAWQRAVLATRLPKGERLDEATLREKWATEAEDVGLTPDVLAEAIARSGQRVVREADWQAVTGRILGVDGLTAGEASFCRLDVLRELAAAAGSGATAAELDERVARVLGSEDVVPVLYGRDPVTGGLLPGHNPREPRYTTRAQLDLEAAVLVEGIERRRGDGSGVVSETVADAAIAGGTVRLGEDQDRAVRGLLADRNGVAVLIAPAGAGKTTSLAVARVGWEAAGLKVEGCAPTAKAAAELGDRGGMPTHTCAQVLAYDQRKAGMPAGGVMVIDEAGMLGTRDLARLLKAADNAHTKVILVGDPSQLQPISAGGLLRGIATQVGAQELTANRRQQQRLDRDALARMRAGEGAAAIDRLVAEGRVMVADSQPAAWAACTADWWRAARDNPTQAQMIARTNEDVRALNQHAREIVAAEGRLSGPVASNRFGDFQAGDRIECRNTPLGRKHGVANRDVGVVRAVEDGGLVVDLDREAQVRLPAAYLPHVQHGYAVTCHGVQGATYDHTYVLGAGSREWTYTALSRHRVDTHMYLSSSQSDDGELDLPRQLQDALGTARRAAAGSEAKPAAIELAPRTQSDADLRAEIEHTAETLRTRPVYAKAMPDADERLAKRTEWDAEHAPDLARGAAAGDELRWRQHARTVAAEAKAPAVKAPTIERVGPVLERVS